MTDTPDVTSYSGPEHIASAHESGMTFESAMGAIRFGHAVAREEWGRKYRVFKISYRDQPYLVEEISLDLNRIQPYAPIRSDREASDWKVVEWPTVLDKADEEKIPMNFPDAFSKLLQSEAIRRASWDETETIWVETDTKHRTGYHPRVEIRFLKRTNPQPFEWKTEDWVPDAEDITATDWTTTTY